MKRILFALMALGATTLLQAELPESVMEAALAPTIADRTSGQSWQVTNRARFESGDLTIQEFAGAFSATQPGLPHPSDWATTEVTLRSPVVSDDNPQPMQTFDVAITMGGRLVPQMTVDMLLIDNATLPPYEVKAWAGHPALVAKDGSWYLIVRNPKASIRLTSEAPQRTTVRVDQITLTKGQTAQEGFWIGEGALPPEPAAKKE